EFRVTRCTPAGLACRGVFFPPLHRPPGSGQPPKLFFSARFSSAKLPPFHGLFRSHHAPAALRLCLPLVRGHARPADALGADLGPALPLDAQAPQPLASVLAPPVRSPRPWPALRASTRAYSNSLASDPAPPRLPRRWRRGLQPGP